MNNSKTLEIKDHFINQCIERAPWLVKSRKKKYGGGFELDIPKLFNAIDDSEKIDRPKSISRLIKYGDKTEYYHFKNTRLERQLIFVVENNCLITLYLYNHSWAVRK